MPFNTRSSLLQDGLQTNPNALQEQQLGPLANRFPSCDRAAPSVTPHSFGPGAGTGQPPLHGHRGALQEGAQLLLEAETGGVAHHCGPIPPSSPSPNPGPGAGSETEPTKRRPTLPLRITPAPKCVPHTRRPKQTVLRPDGLGSQEQQRRPVGSKVGWNGAAGTWPRDLGRGQVPPHSHQASEPGASLPLKPNVWGQASHPAPETRHGTWNS